MIHFSPFLTTSYFLYLQIMPFNEDSNFLTEKEKKNLTESLAFFLRFKYEILAMSFFFIKVSKIHENNLLSMFFYLNNRFQLKNPRTLLVGFSKAHKLIWTNFSYSPFKFFNKNKLVFSNFFIFFLRKGNSKKSILNNMIYIKKKSGFLKKKDKTKNNILLRSNILRNYKFLFAKNKKKKNNVFYANMVRNKVKPTHSEFYKFLDFSHKYAHIFNSNRNILKNILYFKKLRQYQITKFFSKIIKHSFLNTKFMFECSLYNIILRAGFSSSLEESIFLIKNNWVYVNGVLQNNPYFTLSKGDVVNLILSRKLYQFRKHDINKKIRLTFSLGYILWRLNRFKNNFYKQSPTRIPDWVLKLTFAYEDVPSFLEVDYNILACSIVKTPSKFSTHNFYFNKFINFFIMRQYNWKYLI